MEIKLNLIPPYKKAESEKARQMRLVRNIGFFLIFLAGIFFGFLFAINEILKINYNIAAKTPETFQDKEQYEKIRQLDNEFERINAEVVRVSTVGNDQLYWSDLFVRLSKSLTSKITLTSLATKDFNVYIVGKAGSRDDLIAFKDKLDQEECFYEVNLPLSNLISKEDIDFQIDFKVKKECLKRK